jgi:hypothetical protein
LAPDLPGLQNGWLLKMLGLENWGLAKHFSLATRYGFGAGRR